MHNGYLLLLLTNSEATQRIILPVVQMLGELPKGCRDPTKTVLVSVREGVSTVSVS